MTRAARIHAVESSSAHAAAHLLFVLCGFWITGQTLILGQLSVDGFFLDKNAQWSQETAHPSFRLDNATSVHVGSAVLCAPVDPWEPPGALWDFVRVRSEASGELLELARSSSEDMGFLQYVYGGARPFASRAELDAAFPDDSLYRFSVEPDDGSSGSIAFSTPPAGTIPYFTNFDAIQAIDPALSFWFTWNSWEGTAGSGAYIPFSICEVGGPCVAGIGLSRYETGYEVPPYTLEAGKTYVATVNFSSGMSGTGTEWNGEPTGWQYWNYRTTVVFTVPPRNAPPLAQPDVLATRMGTPVSIPIGRLLLNDSDPDGDPLSVVAVGSGAQGTTTLAGAVVTYTPAPSYIGVDSFTYELSDGSNVVLGTVNVTVRASGPGANVLSVTVSGGDVLVCFGGVTGFTYVLQHAATVGGPWTDLPGPISIPSQANLAEYVHVGGAGQSGFYRTRRL